MLLYVKEWILDAVRKNKKVIKIALWIKEYAHALRVVAGMFFVLALVTGVVWIAGKDVEPHRICFRSSKFILICNTLEEYMRNSGLSVKNS